jgi:hypothetical protein
MMPEKSDLVFDLVQGRISRGEFLRGFESSEPGDALTLRLLEAACRQKNPEDVSLGLAVGFVFGFVSVHKAILCNLAKVEWHQSHEDVISALDELRDAGLVDLFYEATQVIPKYLEYDDARALAVKAIWALGNIGSRLADEKLQIISQSNNPILRDAALHQLTRGAAGGANSA